MSPLPNAERRELLALARSAIEAAVQRGDSPDLPVASPLLAVPSGAFVSLHERGRLRGCIGQIDAIHPLAVTVARCAAAAAMEDPRFPPVTPDELSGLEIEISVLSPLLPVRPEEIEVGRHGLLVSRGWQRGLLLPQVATQFHWNRERFLQETCHKAGLEADAWQNPGTKIEAFTAEVFSETEIRAEHPARAG
jgi:AmmeMemoRadiSam system protein A